MSTSNYNQGDFTGLAKNYSDFRPRYSSSVLDLIISYTNKSSGAEGWEDRSFGNSTENSEYESGRSRRKRRASNDGNESNGEN